MTSKTNLYSAHEGDLTHHGVFIGDDCDVQANAYARARMAEGYKGLYFRVRPNGDVSLVEVDQSYLVTLPIPEVLNA